MENVKAKEFVLRLSALWKEQKRREVLYLTALKKDNLRSVRKLLVQGHFSALIFQKEIRGMYDYFKCLFTDSELEEPGQTRRYYSSLIDQVTEDEKVIEMLKMNETAVMRSYKAILRYVNPDTEMGKTLCEQLDRISGFCEILSGTEKLSLESVH